jgi:hypothetical protein
VFLSLMVLVSVLVGLWRSRLQLASMSLWLWP